MYQTTYHTSLSSCMKLYPHVCNNSQIPFELFRSSIFRVLKRYFFWPPHRQLSPPFDLEVIPQTNQHWHQGFVVEPWQLSWKLWKTQVAAGAAVSVSGASFSCQSMAPEVALIGFAIFSSPMKWSPTFTSLHKQTRRVHPCVGDLESCSRWPAVFSWYSCLAFSSWTGLQHIKGQLAYMSADNFMFHLSLFLAVKNIDARKKLDVSCMGAYKWM